MENYITSLQVAEAYNRKHSDVMGDIRNLNSCPKSFKDRNFTIDESLMPYYYSMTKDGFNLLQARYKTLQIYKQKELSVYAPSSNNPMEKDLNNYKHNYNYNYKHKDMKNLQILDGKTMSSREIAELTEKRHDHVLSDCDKLNESYEKLHLPKIGQMFSIRYLPNGGQTKDRYYLLTKMQTFDLMTGYSVELRIKVNRRWEQLENNVNVPQTLSQALRLAADQAEIIENQTETIKVLEPKAEYCDKVLTSVSTYSTTKIAKELGMSAITLNKKLKELKIQYKQGGQWLLASKYQDKGYTKTKTHTHENSAGLTESSMLTVWTEEGRKFIHDMVQERANKILNLEVIG